MTVVLVVAALVAFVALTALLATAITIALFPDPPDCPCEHGLCEYDRDDRP